MPSMDEKFEEFRNLVEIRERMLEYCDYCGDNILVNLAELMEHILVNGHPAMDEDTRDNLNQDAANEPIEFITSNRVHECIEDNPFGECIYEWMNDPCMDDCVFCHMPYERK